MAANTPLPTLCSSEGSRRTGLPRQARRAPFPGQSPRFRYWEFYGNQLSPSSTYLVTHSTIHLRQHGLRAVALLQTFRLGTLVKS